ncbi:unnamed protein product [Ectocarpus sp. 4 AP-2014]
MNAVRPSESFLLAVELLCAHQAAAIPSLNGHLLLRCYADNKCVQHKKDSRAEQDIVHSRLKKLPPAEYESSALCFTVNNLPYSPHQDVGTGTERQVVDSIRRESFRVYVCVDHHTVCP